MMPLSTFIKLLLALVVAMLVMKYGPWLAFSLLAAPNPSTARRATAVAITVASFVPWILLAGWAIAQADEYGRHVFLLGIALAAAASMVVFTGFDFMRDAHMLAETAPIPWFPIMVGMWALGTAAASAYYRTRR